MPGKQPLATHLIECAEDLRDSLHRAMRDGRVDEREANDLIEKTHGVYVAAQKVDIAQRDGLSRARYGEPARETGYRTGQLDAFDRHHRLARRAKRTA